MLDRLDRTARLLRRRLSPHHWSARRHGPAPGVVAAPEPPARGLLIAQIDGLSRRRLLEAVDEGRMPHLAELFDRGTHGIAPLYSGLPSTTPAVQGELFYGVAGIVPAFAYLDGEVGRVVRMYERDAVTAVERRLAAAGRPLLAGGSSYGNVYTGGASVVRFCMATLGLGDAVHPSRPVRFPFVVVAHLPDLARLGVLAAREAVLGAVDLVAGLRAGQHRGSEVKFAQSRIVVNVVLRELIAVAAAVDLARGLPVVYVNFLGYDECAHRRGPDADIARRSLLGIDAAIGRLERAARRAHRRGYDVWILSDHGQEPTVPYVDAFGATAVETVSEVFRRHGLDVVVETDRPECAQESRGRLLAPTGDGLAVRLLARLVPGLERRGPPVDRTRVTVVAQGPVGHVYPPRPLTAAEREGIVAGLLRSARIPMVLAAEGDPHGGQGPRRVRAWTEAGSWLLPDDAVAVLGADHPALEPVAADLVELVGHPDAGALVLCGWRLGTAPVSFPHENGSHAGPGPEETDAFLVAPLDTPRATSLRPSAAAGTRDRLRPADVHAAALGVLDGTARRPAAAGARLVERRAPVEERPPGLCRILTYNVHGCVGLDTVHDPERVARVIARHDPDVVCLQELDIERPRTAGIDQAAEIAERLGMGVHFVATHVAASERSGNAVLTRHPSSVLGAGPLPALRPFAGREARAPRGALAVQIDLDGRWVHVVATHLGLQPFERRRQVRALVGEEWLGALDPAVPTVLCGDLNGFAWWPELRPLRRRFGDAQRVLDGHRPRATFAGRWPLWRIDHVFVDRRIEVTRVVVPGDPASRVASDHRPLVVDLRLPPPTPGSPGP